MPVSPNPLASERLALDALDWLGSQAIEDPAGVHWTGVDSAPVATAPDDCIYSGGAGILLSLLEAHAHYDDDRWADLADSAARSLVKRVDDENDASFYGGSAGIAFALDAAGLALDAPDLRGRARHLLDELPARFNGSGWGPVTDLLAGNAGIALTALALGDVDLAELALTPLLDTTVPIGDSITWRNRLEQQHLRHHISHGTLGYVHALAATSAASGRGDFLDLALQAADGMVAHNEGGPDRFLVPHSEPLQVHPKIERFSYGWCHGPAGDAQTFRLLHDLTGDRKWQVLVDLCWETVVTSGLPERLRPGFWDNSGRCCGTAGVLALALDREVESGDGLAFAHVLVEDLGARAIRDDTGIRWSNHEFRDDPPDLPPRHGWGQGSSGIIRELLRHARITAGAGSVGYAVQWPDQPTAAPRA